jgi:hypothetical protein
MQKQQAKGWQFARIVVTAGESENQHGVTVILFQMRERTDCFSLGK